MCACMRMHTRMTFFLEIYLYDPFTFPENFSLIAQTICLGPNFALFPLSRFFQPPESYETRTRERARVCCLAGTALYGAFSKKLQNVSEKKL